MIVPGILSQSRSAAPPPSGATYRYFRINFTARTRANFIVMSEIDALIGGSPVTLSGLSYVDSGAAGGGSGGTLADLFDGNHSTYWSFSTNPPRSITIDMGSPTSIDTFGIRSNNSSFDSLAYGPAGFVILGSNDGSVYDTLLTVTGQPIWGLAERRAFTL